MVLYAKLRAEIATSRASARPDADARLGLKKTPGTWRKPHMLPGKEHARYVEKATYATRLKRELVKHYRTFF